MANPKRASMREGPLAALFRKTEDEEPDGRGEPESGAGAAAGKGSSPGAAAAKAGRGQRKAADIEDDGRASDGRAPPPHPRESGLPHPALKGSTQTEIDDMPESDEERVPTPRERLRHAFSSEIPENVMDRPAARAVMDDYSREHPAPAGAPVGSAGPVGQPVIRVVGVGGAGVNAVNRM